MKKIILCSTAILLAQVGTANAQNNQKPVTELNMCEGTGEYRLVDAGAPGAWLQPTQNNWGGYMSQSYDANNPPATCDTGLRAIPLKCVTTFGEEDSTFQNCTSGRQMDDYSALHNFSRSIYYEYDYETGQISGMNAVESQNMGACQGDQYAWSISPPDTRGICGTGTVTNVFNCINVRTKAMSNTAFCNAADRPSATREITSTEGCDHEYIAGNWSVSPPSCGQAMQTREVYCQASSGERGSDTNCARSLMPNLDDYHEPEEFDSYNWGSEYGMDWGVGEDVRIFRIPYICLGENTDAMIANCEAVNRSDLNWENPYHVRPRTVRYFNDTRACGEDDPSENYAEYEWAAPVYIPDAPTCGTNVRRTEVRCLSKSSGSEVDQSLCNPAARPPAEVEFEDTSSCPKAPAEESDPTPAPPTAAQEVDLGPCRYTSGGGSGRHACGYGTYLSASSNPAPLPSELCAGTLLSGSIGANNDLGGYDNISPGGRGWSQRPVAREVAGAQCVVHMRYMGYSDSNETMWKSFYFSGPRTSKQGGIFIGRKP